MEFKYDTFRGGEVKKRCRFNKPTLGDDFWREPCEFPGKPKWLIQFFASVFYEDVLYPSTEIPIEMLK